MPPTEVCVIHPGALSASSWTRIASYLPAGTPVKVLELDPDPELTVEALAERLLPRLLVPRDRVLVGWGVGGAVADALDTPSRRVVVFDGYARGALDEPDLLRSFAMYIGACRGRPLAVEPDLARIAEAIGASPAIVGRCYEQHAERVLRDHRLAEAYQPSGAPLTVVKAVRSLAPDSRALGWDRYAPVELLASSGDHYSMLTEPPSAAHLAMLLARWITPAFKLAA
jgi:thioesterase domain-containing protein